MEKKQTASAYTPGPWYFDPVELIVYDGREETSTRVAMVEQRDEKTEDADETSANGWLIAASPELLEACEEQLANWRMLRSSEWDGNPEGVQLAIAHLEDVIARSRGEFP